METNVSKQSMGWGVVLITFGISAMVQNIFPDLSDWVYGGILAAGGLGLLAFFLMDRSDWGVLIPAYVLLATALIVMVALVELFAKNDLTASVVLLLIAVPFLAVYMRDRAQWWALIPGYILLAIAVVILLETLDVVGGQAIGALITGSIGIPFLVVYFKNKEQWWALIPAYTMFAVSALIGIIEPLSDEEMVIPAYVMFAIAFPFFYVYFRNRVLNLLNEAAVVVEELLYPFKKGKFREVDAKKPGKSVNAASPHRGRE